MTDPPLDIRLLREAAEAEWCARTMTASEPWITLGRGHDESLRLATAANRETYLAREGSARLGFLILNMQGAFVGYVQTICVAPEARGRGVGTRLLAFAEERIFRESPNVFMCVSSFNAGARRLYERLGYERVGELRDYIASGHSEILLRKTRGALRDFPRRP